MDRTATIEQETTGFVPVTSYLTESARDTVPPVETTTLDGFSTFPICALFLGNGVKSSNSPHPYNSTAAVYSNNGTAAIYSNNATAAMYSNNGLPAVYFRNRYSPLTTATYRGQGSGHVKKIKLTKKNIIIIAATTVTLVVIAIIGSLSYYFTKKSDKDVTFYGTLYLNGLDYDDPYGDITSPAASELTARLCDWLMNDVTPKVQTAASFNTCQVTGYSRRRGSVMASFVITLSMSVGIRDKINVLETETIKDILLAAILTKSESKVDELDIVITYLSIYKTSLGVTQSPDQTVVPTLSTVSTVFKETTEPHSMTTPANPCSSNPCPTGIACVDIGDDFFCECQVCNCTAHLVDKTCGTIPSTITGSCKDLGDGYYPVVTDCTKYLRCYSNENSTRPCSLGTAYNPNAKPCGNKLECSENIIRKPPSED